MHSPTGFKLNRLRNYWPLLLIGLLVLSALALFVFLQLRPVAAPSPPVAAPIAPTVPTRLPLPTAIPASLPTPAPSITQLAADTLTPEDLLHSLLRTGIRPEGIFPSVDVVLADTVYFAVTGRELPAAVQEEPSIIFYVAENSHEDLPELPPAPILKVDGQEVAPPVESIVLADSNHHRTTYLRYAALDADGQAVVTPASEKVQLYFAGEFGETASNVLTWKLPVAYTAEIVSREIIVGLPEPVAPAVAEVVAGNASDSAALSVADAQPVVTGSSAPATGVVVATAATRPATRYMSWAAILAIMAGMLTVLSPCLIQLVVYYTATLAGVSIESGSQGQLDVRAAQKHIIQTGLFFALGFTAIYTAGGAAAGYIGQSLDKLGLLTTWMRPISIVAGLLIVLMAFRVAWNAKAPLVCRLPMGSLFGRQQRTGLVASVLMGMSFAGGCMACFSATVLPALLLYAGSTGSVFYGSLLLLVFSLGVTVPCLLLAFGISRAQPLMNRLQTAGPMLGLFSAVVMAAFGIIMITDQFHVVSGFVYQAMGLS